MIKTVQLNYKVKCMHNGFGNDGGNCGRQHQGSIDKAFSSLTGNVNRVRPHDKADLTWHISGFSRLHDTKCLLLIRVFSQSITTLTILLRTRCNLLSWFNHNMHFIKFWEKAWCLFLLILIAGKAPQTRNKVQMIQKQDACILQLCYNEQWRPLVP